MTGEAYEQSARMARSLGPFPGYREARCSGVSKPVSKNNVAAMQEVIDLHRCAVNEIPDTDEFAYLKQERKKSGTKPPNWGNATAIAMRKSPPRAHRHDQFPDGL